MTSDKPTYTQDEINEIIRRALDAQAERRDDLDHDDLVAIADEAGIDRASLERATAELAQVRTRKLAQHDEAMEIREERALQLKRFGSTLVSHAVMNGILYFVDTRFFHGAWFKWPLLCSAILLTFRLRHVIAPHDRLLRRRKRERRRRERQEKRAERAAWKQEFLRAGGTSADGAKEFEKVVQSGVAALLQIASRKIDEHANRHRSRDEK